MRYILNGSVTVGSAKFWRVDDTELMERPDYNPLTFIRQPFALINANLSAYEQAQALVDKWNRETVPA